MDIADLTVLLTSFAILFLENSKSLSATSAFFPLIKFKTEDNFLGLVLTFLLIALIYVIYTALRQFKSIIFRQKRPLTDYQVCLLAGILITVWPLTTNGNFFNNWLMIIYSLPVGFYLQSIYSKN